MQFDMVVYRKIYRNTKLRHRDVISGLAHFEYAKQAVKTFLKYDYLIQLTWKMCQQTVTYLFMQQKEATL